MTFDDEVAARVAANGLDTTLQEAAQGFLQASVGARYSYNFSWLGRPIIQYPQDVLLMQEIIWRVRPQLIIETGIAHGGSLIFSASMLELVAACGGGEGSVLGVDVDIRAHNRAAIEAHPMFRRIAMIEGSSVDPAVVAQVHARARGLERVLVCLDSNHTHAHVLAELEAYAGLATPGSYCVVFDTLIEDMPADAYPDRPWGPGDNPLTAVRQWLAAHPEFEIDPVPHQKALVTVARDGFLRRVR